MWILLTTKLPTEPSPPKLSIFWSTAWPDEGTISEMQIRKVAVEVLDVPLKKRAALRKDVKEAAKKYINEHEFIYDNYGFGKEPIFEHARRIHYKDTDIRVLPGEYKVQTAELMKEYIFNDNPSHELVADTVADESIIEQILDGVTRPIYEAALLDGANEAQAMQVAMGNDITMPDSEFPPIGWYKCHPSYAVEFCHPWEMKD